jgi:hypothetical protein
MGSAFRQVVFGAIAYSANMSMKHLDCRKHDLGMQCQHYFDTEITAKHIII